MNTYFVFWRKVESDGTTNLRGQSLQAGDVSVDSGILVFWSKGELDRDSKVVFSLPLEDVVSFKKVDEQDKKPELDKSFIEWIKKEEEPYIPPIETNKDNSDNDSGNDTEFTAIKGLPYQVSIDIAKMIDSFPLNALQEKRVRKLIEELLLRMVNHE